MPFRKGPLFQGRGRGQQSVWKSPNFYQGKGQERGKHSFSFHKTDNRNTSLPIFKGTSNGKVSFFSECGFKYHPSRESRGVHRKLESSDTGLSNFKHDQGIQNSLCIKTSSSKYSFPSKSGGGGKFASGSRYPSNASQRCNKGSRIHTGPISQLNFSSAKKGFRTETCNKSKKVEQLYPIPPFQNGECFSSEGNTSERGPYVQNRPQRCILFSSSSSRLTEICKVSVEGQAISIPLPVFWTGACTKKFYQNNESSSSSFEKTQYKVDNIFRRHIDTSFMSQRDGDGEGHSNICPYPSGLYNKFSKVSCSTYPQDQIFRGGSRLNESKVESSHGESGTNYSSVRNSSGSRESYDKRCHAIGRSTLFSSHSSSSGAFTISSNSKTTDTRVIFSEKLRVFHKIVTRGKGRTGLVGSKSPPVKWTTFPSSSTATNNFNRCLQAGLGSSLQGLPDRGTVVSWGENVAHKYSGVESSKASTLLLSPYVPINKINSLENRQYSSIDILEKDGGGTHSRALTDLSKQIWEYLLSHKITITVEYLPGVLNVEADTLSRNLKDSSEWKLNKQVFLDICRVRGTPCTDLFASRLSHQVPQYFSWKIDPYSISADAFQACWTHLKGYAFPPFSLIGRVLWKVRADQSTIVLITPAWKTQAWYPQLLELSIKNPIMIPQLPFLLRNPQGQAHPLVKNQSLRLVPWTVSGVSCKQKEYQKKLPTLSFPQEETARSLITNRPGESGLAGVLREKYIPFDVL